MAQLFDRTTLSGLHLNHASLDFEEIWHKRSPWWDGVSRTKPRPVPVSSRPLLEVKGQNEKPCIIRLQGTHVHHDEVIMAEVKTNFAKKGDCSLLSFNPFPLVFPQVCRRVLMHSQHTILVITVIKLDAVSATIICLVNF